MVVAITEVVQGSAEFIEITETADPQELLFQGAEEALDAAVALGLADEGRGRLDAEEANFVLEVIAHVNAAVVVAQAQTARDACGKKAEVLVHALSDGLERFEPAGSFGYVKSDALGGAMVDGSKDGNGTVLLRGGLGGIGSPHLVRTFSDDRAFMRMAGNRKRTARRRQQAVLTKKAKHAVLRRTDPLVAQTRPDLAISFTGEDGGRQQLPDLVQ